MYKIKKDYKNLDKLYKDILEENNELNIIIKEMNKKGNFEFVNMQKELLAKMEIIKVYFYY